MGLLILGVMSFAAVIGFLSGTNNSAVLSTGLFAGITAITVAFGLIEKLYVDRSFSATELSAFSEQRAKSLGQVLLAITLGFSIGLAAGICAHVRNPWLLGDKVKVPLPWLGQSSDMPTDIKEAIGWIAMSERLRQNGASEEQINQFFKKYRTDPSSKELILDLGKKWSDKGTTLMVPPAGLPPASAAAAPAATPSKPPR